MEQTREMDEARRKYSRRLGIPTDDVPWQVVFLSDRPLTEAEKQWGEMIAESLGRDG